ARDIEGGLSFSEALKKYPDIFPEIYINMIKVGESSGELDKALNELATQQEKDYELLAKIRSALAYPAFIFASLIVVGTVMVIFVMPQLSGLFEDAGEDLPFVTKFLIGFSNFVQNFWWVVALLILLLGIGLYYYIKTPAGRSNWDLFKIKVPVVGGMLKKIYIARFSGMLQTLERSGIPIVKALLIASNSITNVHYKKALEKAAKDVENGVPLGTSLARHPYFPNLVIQMIKVGEKTGKLDEVLDKMEEFYRREVDVTAKTFSSLIEPVLMVIIGIVIGVVVASVILPIYNLAGAL
ncbi:type II secretion system F family protein, partial [Patescibacteria group bacterium]